MFRSIHIRKGVFLFSTVLVALLMWLSVSFLLLANSQRQDAQRLTHFIETDEILREASTALAKELSASYWLTGIDEFLFASDSLIRPYAATDEALFRATSHVRDTIAKPGLSNRLRFHRSHLKLLIDGIEEKTNQLTNQRSALVDDLYFPSIARDQTLQLTILDYYQGLIEQLQLLRYGLIYDSSTQSRDIKNTLEVSNSAWNVHSSNHLLTTFFEAFIATGNTAHGDAYSRATVLHQRIEENLSIIKQIDAYAKIDPTLHKLAVKLSQWYEENYNSPVTQISLAMANASTSPYSIDEWKKEANTLSELTQSMLDRADVISKQQASSAERVSVRNLYIDVVLVLICGLLMLCTYWLIRGMHHQTTHDELTDLPNRRLFRTHLEKLLDSGGQTANTGLIKIDLHKFKAINDSFGQGAGDKLLQSVAKRLCQNVGPCTLVARLAGDEYAVVLTETDRTQARQAAFELSDRLSDPYEIDGQRIQLNTYIGYACFPEDASDFEQLRKAVDLALHEAKQRGSGSVTSYKPDFSIAFQNRVMLEAELSQALERNEFELYYQPQFDLQNGVVDGVEALIRWNHPTRGLVSPFHFIPVAEDAGLLPSIGEWVINEAVQQAVRWQQNSGLHLRMSVNVSPEQFLHGDIINIVTQTLRRDNLRPSDLEIEITESVALAELDLVVGMLEQLHTLGVRIALDDFGTGYSSLSYLQDLPLDTLKIDRSFISKLDQGTGKERPLLESIATMARLLEFHTIAEGVETNGQLVQVQALNIDTVQGYYYSKPVCAEQIPGVVAELNKKHHGSNRKAA